MLYAYKAVLSGTPRIDISKSFQFMLSVFVIGLVNPSLIPRGSEIFIR
jgi:hypothetical protein